MCLSILKSSFLLFREILCFHSCKPLCDNFWMFTFCPCLSSGSKWNLTNISLQCDIKENAYYCILLDILKLEINVEIFLRFIWSSKGYFPPFFDLVISGIKFRIYWGFILEIYWHLLALLNKFYYNILYYCSILTDLIIFMNLYLYSHEKFISSLLFFHLLGEFSIWL